MKKSISILLVLLAVGFASCRKKGCTDETAQNYNPDAKKDDGSCEYYDSATVNIMHPVEGTMYNLNDTVHIHGSISHTEELHGYHLELINMSENDTVVYTLMNHDHETSYSLNGMWVNNVTGHSNMKLRLEVTKTHGEPGEVHEVMFHCHPM